MLAKLIRSLIADEPAPGFVCLADLTAALKDKCGRLRIPWTSDAINEAFRLIGSNTALVVDAPAVRRRRHLDDGDPQVFTRQEAADVLRRLGWPR